MTQEQLDAAFVEFCAAAGVVMDSGEDRADFAARGQSHEDPGSDVHDHQGRA